MLLALVHHAYPHRFSHTALAFGLVLFAVRKPRLHFAYALSEIVDLDFGRLVPARFLLLMFS